MTAGQASLFRRRSGPDTDVAQSIFQFPPGTDPSWLAPYQVHCYRLFIFIVISPFDVESEQLYVKHHTYIRCVPKNVHLFSL